MRTYPFIPDFAGGMHVANVEVLRVSNPPRVVSITQMIPNLPVGVTAVPAPLATKELGDYVQYVHYAAVGSPGQVRLAQIDKMVINPSARTVRVEAVDCEDLVNYDTFDAAVSVPSEAAPLQAPRFAPDPMWQTV